MFLSLIKLTIEFICTLFLSRLYMNGNISANTNILLLYNIIKIKIKKKFYLRPKIMINFELIKLFFIYKMNIMLKIKHLLNFSSNDIIFFHSLLFKDNILMQITQS
jgi:hypothetical protein